MLTPERVVVAYRDSSLCYPPNAPFDPEVSYPEYPFGSAAIGSRNSVYGAVREVLRRTDLDSRHSDTPNWNPLGELVQPGGTVLIKPNWVRHYHLRGDDVFSLITHPSVLRPLIDYAFRAVGPNGQIWLMDAPLFDTCFAELTAVCQLRALQNELRARGVPLTIADLRSLTVESDSGVVTKRIIRRSWESEGIEFELGDESELAELGASLSNVFGSDYDRRVTHAFHAIGSDGRHSHRYRISRRALEADLVISVPKLKTHKKTGVTLNLKNMIGINTDKTYIPHYRVGAPQEGGDEFPDTRSLTLKARRKIVRHAIDILLGRLGDKGERLAQRFMRLWLALTQKRLERRAGHQLDPIDVFYRTIQRDTYRTGNWWGNDTCWRCGVDINRILIYGTLDGQLSHLPMRHYLSIIDGIVGGEGDGPLAPTPRRDGVLIAGFDPVSVDIVGTQIMGFNPELIRDLQRASCLARHPLTVAESPIKVRSNCAEWDGGIQEGSTLGFRPHTAWTDYLEALR